MFQIDFWALANQALELLLRLLMPVLVGFVVAWGTGLYLKGKAWLETKVSAEIAAQLYNAARIAVFAAEQSGLAGLIVNTATSKKAYAVGVAEQWLAARKINLDLDIIANAIEAAVREEFGWLKTIGSPPVLTGTGSV